MQYNILAMNGEDSDYIDDKIVEYNLSKMPAACENNRVVKWYGKKITDCDGKVFRVLCCRIVKSVFPGFQLNPC